MNWRRRSDGESTKINVKLYREEREREREKFGTGISSTAPVRRPPLTEYRQ